MTQIIVKALETTGQRGIINKGWGGLGDCEFLVLISVLILFCLKSYKHYMTSPFFFLPVAEPKDFIYSLDNVPHDWLFLQCKAVVRF